jgi:hypothetical protein
MEQTSEQSFTRLLSYFLKAFWLYGPGVFTVLLSYFLLTSITQGQDVLMILGESKGAAGFGILAVTLWAFIVWYSSRLIGYEKLYDDNRWPKRILSVFPRMLAYNAFVSVQAAIIALPTLHQLSMGWLILFIALHNAYYFLLFSLFSGKSKRPALGYSFAAVAAFAYVLYLLSELNSSILHEFWLPIVAVLLFVIQIISLRWFVHRRTAMDNAEAGKKYSEESDYLRFLSVRLTRVPKWFLAHEQFTFNVFNAIALLAFILFVAMLISLRFTIACGPLVVLLLMFGLLAGVLNQITAVSIRLGINLFVFLFIWAWFIGQYNDNYQLRFTQHKGYSFNQRPDLATYFRCWVENRKDKIDTVAVFPVYVVLADGGASRSGYWVASVLNAWQNLYPHPTGLQDHLLCLSGASGGGVGNAAYYAQLKTGSKAGSANRFLQNDFLSYCLLHLLGTDPARHLVPLPFRDRAHAIAETMEQLSAESLQGVFAQNWEEVIDTTGQLPILLINTTRVQGGMPAVVSSVQLKGFSKRFDVLQSLDTTNLSFSLATASILGARFPYVSPAGRIGNYQFVDGGYFDNSGAGVVHEMLYHIDSLCTNERDTELRRLYNKLQLHVVHISNSPPPGKEPKVISTLANDLATPLLTVFNTYAAQTEVNDQRLEQYIVNQGGAYKNINLYAHDKGQDYPMNWVISEYRLKLMDQLVEKTKADELKKLVTK